ncbi:MAG TPA: extracellular solute-binding protein [Ruminiclostridium sp.]
MNAKKLVSIILATTLVVGLSACGSSSTTTQSSSSPSAVVSSASNEKVSLEFWTLWTAEPYKTEIANIAKEFNVQNPNVTINISSSQTDPYKTKIKTAIAANEQPDIFVTYTSGFSEPFIKAEKVLSLDEYLDDATKAKLIPDALTNVTYDGKVYGLPFTTQIGLFYIYEDLFTQNNIKVPTTFSELMTAVKAFRAKNITPMTVGAKDLWPSMWLYDQLAVREGGAQLCNDALSGKASFTDPAFVRAAKDLQDLVDAKAFEPGVLGISRDEAEVPFLAGKIPMYYGLNSVIGTIAKNNTVIKGKIKAIKFPIIEGGAGTLEEFSGGVNNCLMISANTKYKVEAVNATKFIAQAMGTAYYKTGAGIPAWNVDDVDKSTVEPLNAAVINEIIPTSKKGVLAWDVFLPSDAAKAHQDLVAQIIGKQITPEEFATQMQSKINKK